MKRDYDNSYVGFARAQSRAHRDTIMKLPLAPEVAERFAQLARESVEEQRRVEGSDSIPFEAFRQLYLAPVRLSE